MNKVLQNGAWDQWTADKYHQSSPKLAAWMAKELSHYEDQINSPVIDFGCGNGFYIGELAAIGFKCTGIEGYKLNNFYHDNIIIHDLTKPLDLGFKGSVISLEVMEHIDKKYESILLDTITKHCDGTLILSWALTNQSGIGHVNCVDQSYAIDQVVKRGFKFMVRPTNEARENVDDNTDWFRRTLLVFRNKK
jgi:hypothetical protein